jgi:hypothetical protein
MPARRARQTSRPKSPVRIIGLVKVMNRARQDLADGLPPAEAEEFRQMVRDAIREVDKICREQRISPDQLPTPSYRAYQYLRSIDLTHLPPPTSRTRPQPATRLRIKNLVSGCNDLQNQLFAAASNSLGKVSDTARLAAFGILLQTIQTDAASTEALCQEQHVQPTALPAQSRRAYQWLKFLSDPANLALHLETLKTAIQEAHQPDLLKKLPTARRSLPIQIEFFNTPALYRARGDAHAIHITASEGFIGAPREVIRALLLTVFQGKRSPALAELRQYAASEEFAEIVLAIELTISSEETAPHGQYFNLDTVFERVNREYFHSRLPRPRLVWNQTITQRKLGHYQPTNDTLMLSITLDQPDVPAYVVEFVMYHELLHKHLGIQVVNGRRYGHTSQFRAAERKFQLYEAAQAFLKKLGQGI